MTKHLILNENTPAPKLAFRVYKPTPLLVPFLGIQRPFSLCGLGYGHTPLYYPNPFPLF